MRLKLKRLRRTQKKIKAKERENGRTAHETHTEHVLSSIVPDLAKEWASPIFPMPIIDRKERFGAAMARVAKKIAAAKLGATCAAQS